MTVRGTLIKSQQKVFVDMHSIETVNEKKYYKNVFFKIDKPRQGSKYLTHSQQVRVDHIQLGDALKA